MKMYKFLLVLLLSFIFLTCNKKDNIVDPINSDPQAVIPATSKVINQTEYLGNILTISPDSLQFVFRKGGATIDNLDSTNVITIPDGEGILRKVTGVQKNASTTTIYTQKTSLSKAIQSGTVSLYRQLLPSDTTQVVLSEGVKMKRNDKSGNVFEFEINKEYGAAKITGTYKIAIDFNFVAKFSNFSLKECEISSTKNEETNLTVTFTSGYSIEKEWEVGRIKFSPILVPVMGWPVIFTPSIPIKVGLNGGVAAALVTSVGQVNQTTSGLQFKNNQWSPISTESHNFTYTPPSLNFSANVEGYVKPSLEVKLYGVVGPYINAKLSGGIEAEQTSISLFSYVAFKVGAGVKFEILDLISVGYWVDDIINKKERWLITTLSNNGSIAGNVKDAVTQSPIMDCQVKVYKNNTNYGSTSTLSNGNYLVNVPEGEGYNVEFVKPGYLTANYFNISVVVSQNTNLETVLQIDNGHSGVGNISGKITNALTGVGANGVTLRLRQGINVFSGNVLNTISTGSDGNYLYNSIQAGYYTVEASASGFTTMYFNVISIGGQTTGNQNASITPNMSLTETRIVLTWGAEPYDLDEHFTGPLSSGGRFHMYYLYKGENSPWPSIVKLDVDDVTSYGPETTTLYQQTTGGVYRFSVHDYSNCGTNYSTALSNSGAQVKVYKGSALVATFNVPQNREGTLWRVFEMVNNQITPINTFSYVSDPGTIDSPGEGFVKGYKKNK